MRSSDSDVETTRQTRRDTMIDRETAENQRTVYKAGGRSGTSGLMIHSIPNCRQLVKANTILEKPEAAFPSWVERHDCTEVKNAE